MFVGGVECGAVLSKDQEAKHLHHALHLLAPRTGSAVVGDDLVDLGTPFGVVLA